MRLQKYPRDRWQVLAFTSAYRNNLPRYKMAVMGQAHQDFCMCYTKQRWQDTGHSSTKIPQQLFHTASELSVLWKTLMNDERGVTLFCCFADFVQEILHFQRKPRGIGPSVLLSQMGNLCKVFRPTSLPTAALLLLWPTSSEAAWVLDWIQLFPLNSKTALPRSRFNKELARYFRDFFILSSRSMSVPEYLAYLHEKYFFNFGKSSFSCLRPSL